MSGIVSGSQIDNSGVVGGYPAGHIIQVTSMTPNNTGASSTGSSAATNCAHSITISVANKIFITGLVPIRFANVSGDYIDSRIDIFHSTDGSSYSVITDAFTRIYWDNAVAHSGAYLDQVVAFSYLHTPGATTNYYKIYIDLGGSSTVTVSQASTYSQMTLMEVVK